MWFNTIFITFCLFSFEFGNINADCKLVIRSDQNYELYKQPLYLNENYELWPPSSSSESGYLIWKKGEKIIVSCPGENNEIMDYGVQEMKISCENNIFFRAQDGDIVEINDLTCTEIIKASFRNIGNASYCSGNLGEIGFETNNPKYSFSKFVEVCYDDSKLTPIYTHHIFPAVALQYRTLLKPFVPFEEDAGFIGLNDLYKGQEKRLKTILGDNVKYYYNKEKSFLIEGRLTPYSDSIFPTWQLATSYYVNTAPIWRVVNGGNWDNVEEKIRDKAVKLKDTLEIYTGVHGILKVEGKRITLGGNGDIPVPKYFWKIIKYKNEGIAFVTSNKPFAREEPPCTNICKTSQWHKDSFDNYDQGLTFCCHVNELFFPGIPDQARFDKVLAF